MEIYQKDVIIICNVKTIRKVEMFSLQTCGTEVKVPEIPFTLSIAF